MSRIQLVCLKTCFSNGRQKLILKRIRVVSGTDIPCRGGFGPSGPVVLAQQSVTRGFWMLVWHSGWAQLSEVATVVRVEGPCHIHFLRASSARATLKDSCLMLAELFRRHQTRVFGGGVGIIVIKWQSCANASWPHICDSDGGGSGLRGRRLSWRGCKMIKGARV